MKDGCFSIQDGKFSFGTEVNFAQEGGVLFEAIGFGMKSIFVPSNGMRKNLFFAK
uniref:hypothetical protein n=1 Tax=Fulvivirga sp. TaxID=1931237 RepID=UPI00404B19B2